MFAHLNWFGRPLRIDFSRGRSLAIPLNPHGPQPAFFSASAMHAEPVREGSFIGDVRHGGSCNAEWLHWAPHCHGTHTECIGHILAQRLAVLDVIDTSPVLAMLHTALDERGVIRQPALEQSLDQTPGNHAALILRTLPNDPGKKQRDYSAEPHFPVLETAAIAWLASLPLRHLLLDTPSLDAPHNQNLDNHRAWWGEDKEIRQHGYPPQQRSVTEMIYVPDEIPDGEYWLHLELSPLVSDATASRPMIYPVASIE